MPAVSIEAPVGRGGLNRRADVTTVQLLINRNLNRLPGLKALVADGASTPALLTAIEQYQRRVVGLTAPDGRVDPGGRTFRSLRDTAAARVRLAVAIHGWPGLEHATSGFKACALTKAGEPRDAATLIRGTSTRVGLLRLWNDLAEQGTIQELHFYSHAGIGDGPIFQDGQILTDTLHDGALAKLDWTEGATAFLYGCNAGLSGWSTVFAATQGVEVMGSAGFSLFSRSRFEFLPFKEDPDQPPCYLDCFHGLQYYLRKKYGLTKASNSLGAWFREVSCYPGVLAARLRADPPEPMVRIHPDGTKD